MVDTKLADLREKQAQAEQAATAARREADAAARVIAESERAKRAEVAQDHASRLAAFDQALDKLTADGNSRQREAEALEAAGIAAALTAGPAGKSIDAEPFVKAARLRRDAEAIGRAIPALEAEVRALRARASQAAAFVSWDGVVPAVCAGCLAIPRCAPFFVLKSLDRCQARDIGPSESGRANVWR